MNTWIKIAVRNLLKQKRRSFFTSSAIALGFAAVCVFGGFTRYMFWGLREAYIYGQANGNLTVFKKGFLDEASVDPLASLLTEEDIQKFKEIAGRDPRILVVAPQLFITGLISNGDVSTIFVGNGRVPSATLAIMQRSSVWAQMMKRNAAAWLDGKVIEDGSTAAVGLSRGLAAKLKLGKGDDSILMAPTVEGQMNALNAEVYYLFEASSEMLNDKAASVSLAFAQALYDTTSADRIAVLLDNDKLMPAVKADLERACAEAGLDVQIESWIHLCPSYTKIADMFNTIFTFLFVIVFVIVVLSVINTVSMAVMERTREIGTLRALGLKHRGVLLMFATESALLGLIGSLVGTLITVAAWGAIKWFEPMWSPPTFSRPSPLVIYIVPEFIALATVSLLLLAVAAAALPARRAARMSIIDALGHV